MGAVPYLLDEALERETKEIFSNADVSDVFLWLLFVRCSACNKPIESDMCTALPDGIHSRKFYLSQKNLPEFEGHNCPSVHYIRDWNTPVVVLVPVFLLPLGLHPWVALDPLTDLLPLLCWLHIHSPISARNSRDSSHHLNFGLPLLLSPFPSVLVQTNFFAGSPSSILHHLSSPSKSTNLNKLHSITFIIKHIYFRVFAPPPTSIFNYLAEYFP